MTLPAAKVILPGIVDEVIIPPPGKPEKAVIAVEGADELYKEIRIENTLTDKDGSEVSLNPGAPVKITIKADPPVAIEKA